MSSDASTDPASPPAAAAPEVAPPAAPAPAPARPAAWPDWFPAYDLALGVLAVLLAFLVASFVARNSDFWRHVAAGRLLATFQYPVGGDPFTFTAADRPWVNPNWLSEVILYGLYSADTSGAVAVAVKAMAFAAAFAVLFLLRKPNAALWPWAAAAAAAAVGACANTHLRPYVFGLVMLAVSQVVLFSGDWAAGSRWRRPLVFGGVTALWANLDAFAVLAPLSVALVLVGELLHRQLFRGTADETAAAGDPFPPVPPLPALARTLGVAAAACLLNPTFLAAAARNPGEAVAQLVPFELDFATAAVLRGDDDLARNTFTAMTPEYRAKTLYGNNVSGAAATGLAVLAVVLSAVGYRGGRASHLVLWLGFALLAVLAHARFVPHLMVLSVPLVAAHLNTFSARWADLAKLRPQTARTLVTLSRVGRVATAVALVLLMVVAWPGWVQPFEKTERPLDRWVAWGVEPEAGMKRAAETIQGWRTAEPKMTALAGVRGLLTAPELGDYLAWFAPAEKAFVNSRYRLHRAELPDLLELRKVLFADLTQEQPADRPFTALLVKRAAEYVCIARELTPLSAQVVVRAQSEVTGPIPLVKYGSGADSLWHMDGRLGVVGRADTPDGAARAPALVWDVTRQAFGPSAGSGDTAMPLDPGGRPQVGWQYDFLLRPKVPPVEVDDATTYSEYAAMRKATVADLGQRKYAAWRFGLLPALAALGGGPGAFQNQVIGPPAGLRAVQRWDYDYALPVVTVRAARAAARTAPESAAAFQALAQAYQQDLVPETDPQGNENRIQILTALTRALARFPAPVEGERSRDTQAAFDIGAQLVRQHLTATSTQDLHLDLARQTLGEMNVLARGADDDDFRALRVDGLWAEWLRAVGQLFIQPNLPPTLRLQNDQVTEALFRGGVLEEPRAFGERMMRQGANVTPEFMKAYQEASGVYRQMFQLLSDQGVLAKTDALTDWLKPGTPVPPAVARKKLERLEASMQEMVRLQNDLVERGAAGRPAEDKFQILINAGLPGRAIEMVEEAGDKTRGGSISLTLSAKYTALLLKVGRVELAHERRTLLEEALAADPQGDNPVIRDLRQLTRRFELVEARLAGDYKKADALEEEQFRPVAPPRLTDAQKAIVRTDASQLLVGVAALTGPPHLTYTERLLAALRNDLAREADHWFQRGLLALYDGDTALARRHFDAAASPQGVDLTLLGVSPQMTGLTEFLPKYRELLARYAAPPK